MTKVIQIDFDRKLKRIESMPIARRLKSTYTTWIEVTCARPRTELDSLLPPSTHGLVIVSILASSSVESGAGE